MHSRLPNPTDDARRRTGQRQTSPRGLADGGGR